MPAPEGNQYALGNEGGRPTKYKKEYAEQVYKLCLLGATDKELADFFEVDEQTINNWKKEHKEFFVSLNDGKKLADANVVESLYKRATGYSHKAVKIFQVEGEPLIVPYTEHFPPDPTSMIFWLKNRQRKKWRDKVETGITDADGNDVQAVTIFQIPDNGRKQNSQASAGLPNEGAEQPG